MKQHPDTPIKPSGKRMVEINEALLLASSRQQEPTDAANVANALLKLEITERKLAEHALRKAQPIISRLTRESTAHH